MDKKLYNKIKSNPENLSLLLNLLNVPTKALEKWTKRQILTAYALDGTATKTGYRPSQLPEKTTIDDNDSIMLDSVTGTRRITGLNAKKQLSNASSSGLYASDQSEDSSKVDLVINGSYIESYKDGMQITFKATKDSVNNMQIQLNNLGYKKTTKMGIGSFVTNSLVTIIYQQESDTFTLLNVNNELTTYKEIKEDLNEYDYDCKIKVHIPKGTKNSPNPDGNLYGVLEVRNDNGNTLVHQEFRRPVGDNYEVYVRMSRNDGASVNNTWYKLITNAEFDPILAIYNAAKKESP